MKLKRQLCLTLAVVLTVACVVFAKSPQNASAAANPSVVFNGQLLTFDVPPQIINDRIMLPFRGIAEAMGAQVDWDQDLQKITMYLDSNYIIMTIGDPNMNYGSFTTDSSGEPILNTPSVYVMDSPPVIVGDRTLVPIRAIAEMLGAAVSWVSETSTVYITTMPEPAELPPTQEPIPTVEPVPVESQTVNSITIDGTEYSTSLTKLNLFGKNLTSADIEPLKHMINLISLDLGSNKISDISMLSNLTNLTSLRLIGNQITDISALKNLTNLSHLYLLCNQIRDINDLGGLVNLTDLDLAFNQISDITALKGLTNLNILNLFQNQITVINALGGLTNLTHLALDNNQISDISALKDLTDLTVLTLSNNQISDISALRQLTNLTFILGLSNNQIRDISVLRNLPNLLQLGLDNNQISDISVLRNLPNLLQLGLDNNQITDISPLKGLTNLTSLYLRGNLCSSEQILDLITALPNCRITY